jgi:hypothetical protein
MSVCETYSRSRREAVHTRAEAPRRWIGAEERAIRVEMERRILAWLASRAKEREIER